MGRASKDKRDIYYRKAKSLGYRARSAFKLEHLDEEFDLFKDVNRVIDLCAAPGSWSQYVARRMRQLERSTTAKLLAIDLQEMAPIEGVRILQGDITQHKTIDTISNFFDNEPVDLVISDGAPDVTGLHDVDEYIQAQLVLAALNVATQLLRPKGTFIAKVFRQKDTSLLYAQLKIFFPNVVVAKPRSSRNSSLEAFVVCREYCRPPGYIPASISPNPYANANVESLSEANRVFVPFIAAGDLSALDADRAYDLDAPEAAFDTREVYEALPPVVPPIEPPYAEALRRKRAGKDRKQ